MYYAKLEGVGPASGPPLEAQVLPMTDETIREWNQDSSQLRMIVLLDRPELMLANAAIEHELYPAGTPENAKLTILYFPWYGYEWWVMSVPLQDKGRAEDCLRRWGFRLSDGVPYVFSQGGSGVLGMGSFRRDPKGVTVLGRFPIHSRRAFMVQPDYDGKLPKDALPATLIIKDKQTEAEATRDFLARNAYVERVRVAYEQLEQKIKARNN